MHRTAASVRARRAKVLVSGETAWTRLAPFFLALLAVLCVFALAGPEAAPGAQPRVQVIVRELPGAGNRPERAVGLLGGTVGRHISIIQGFVARIPADRLARLEHAAGVRSVTRDRRIRMLGDEDNGPAPGTAEYLGSLKYIAQEVIGAPALWRQGITGKGVDVALIDTGVVPVEGLSKDKVVFGPDLSFESQADNLRHLDTFGHGTHMAGIIAGRDKQNWLHHVFKDNQLDKEQHGFLGVAPDARIVSLKVGEAGGAADVSQVIAAIDWVVQHRHSNYLNIRVLNLSFGTDGVQPYAVDPLAYAAEVAWRKGIVVVVAGGNAGYGSATLNNPAYDPFVIAVGASDPNGTVKIEDDRIPAWSSGGDGLRNPDFVAPGAKVVSLRSPGSYIDETYPGGRFGERFFRGSGTSQAAAVVSGAAALLLEQRPWITPDQLKRLLMLTARTLPEADPIAQGDGLIDLQAASITPTPEWAQQPWPESTGDGSLELARGSSHLSDEGADLLGEQDIFGRPWDGPAWASASWLEATWSDGFWNETEWTGATWSGPIWQAVLWSGNRWSGLPWSEVIWSENKWSGNRWSGSRWSGNRWSGSTWSGNRWSTAWGS